MLLAPETLPRIRMAGVRRRTRPYRSDVDFSSMCWTCFCVAGIEDIDRHEADIPSSPLYDKVIAIGRADEVQHQVTYLGDRLCPPA